MTWPSKGQPAAFPRVHSVVSDLAKPLAPASAESPYLDPGKGMQLSGHAGWLWQGSITHGCWLAGGGGRREAGRAGLAMKFCQGRAAIFVLLFLRKIVPELPLDVFSLLGTEDGVVPEESSPSWS